MADQPFHLGNSEDFRSVLPPMGIWLPWRGEFPVRPLLRNWLIVWDFRPDVEGFNDFVIAEVESGADEGRDGPCAGSEHFPTGVDGELVGVGCGDGEVAVFIKDDEFAVGIKDLGGGEAALPPGEFAGLRFCTEEEAGAGDAGRAVEEVADAQCGGMEGADFSAGPGFGEIDFVAVAGEAERTGVALGGREEEEAVVAPCRHGDIFESLVIVFMSALPMEVAGFWIEPDDGVIHNADEMIESVDFDDARRGVAVGECVFFPARCAVQRIERDDRAIGSAEEYDE